MIELFTLVALWCGGPTATVSDMADSGNRRDAINKCRKEILDCTQGRDNRSQFYYKYDPQCFVKQKLKP